MMKLEDIIIITSLVYKNQSIISFARSMEINWSVRYIVKEGGNVKYVVAMAGLENIHTVTYYECLQQSEYHFYCMAHYKMKNCPSHPHGRRRL